MTGYFFDTSALAKFYHPEVGTPEIDAIVNSVGAAIRISRLTEVELTSVFAIKVRTQFISRQDARLFVRQFRADVSSRKFEVFGVGDPEFALAERLIEQYAFGLRLRALDAVQLAVGLGLRQQGLVDHFVAADKTLCEVAVLEGFSVFNPEQPVIP